MGDDVWGEMRAVLDSGTSEYDYSLASAVKIITPLLGQNASPATPIMGPITGRQIDQSVSVGGFGGIPIVPNTVDTSALAKMPASLKASGPTISASSYGTFQSSKSTTFELPVQVTIANWTLNAQPNWFLGFKWYTRVHGATSQRHAGDTAPGGNPTSVQVIGGLGASLTVDVGVAFVDQSGDESVTTWPAGLNAIAVPGIASTPLNAQGNIVPSSVPGYDVGVASPTNATSWVGVTAGGLFVGINGGTLYFADGSTLSLYSQTVVGSPTTGGANGTWYYSVGLLPATNSGIYYLSQTPPSEAQLATFYADGVIPLAFNQTLTVTAGTYTYVAVGTSRRHTL
jgi:hypothetical protein